MAKKRERIKAIFDELEAQGKIKPVLRSSPRNYKRNKAKTPDPHGKCCIVRHDNLPKGFKPCLDCPLDSSDPRLLTYATKPASL